jgi:hypothetical protein
MGIWILTFLGHPHDPIRQNEIEILIGTGEARCAEQARKAEIRRGGVVVRGYVCMCWHDLAIALPKCLRPLTHI